jgi:hypothetical protein
VQKGIAAATHAGPTINVGVSGFARNSSSFNAGIVARASRGQEGSGAGVTALHASADDGLLYILKEVFTSPGPYSRPAGALRSITRSIHQTSIFPIRSSNPPR